MGKAKKAKKAKKAAKKARAKNAKGKAAKSAKDKAKAKAKQNKKTAGSNKSKAKVADKRKQDPAASGSQVPVTRRDRPLSRESPEELTSGASPRTFARATNPPPLDHFFHPAKTRLGCRLEPSMTAIADGRKPASTDADG